MHLFVVLRRTHFRRSLRRYSMRVRGIVVAREGMPLVRELSTAGLEMI